MNIIFILLCSFSIACLIRGITRLVFKYFEDKERARDMAINVERYLELDRDLKINSILKRNDPKIKTVDRREQYYKRYNDYYGL